MSTIDIHLRDDLKAYMEKEAAQRGYANSSEFVAALLEADQHRRLKRDVEQMLLETVDGPFSDWTENDLSDIQRAGRRIIEGQQTR